MSVMKDTMRTTYSSELFVTVSYMSAVTYPWHGYLPIFRKDTLKEMSIRVPRTKEELLEINGIGK
jgi:bloom syndrome protein